MELLNIYNRKNAFLVEQKVKSFNDKGEFSVKEDEDNLFTIFPSIGFRWDINF